MFKLRYCSIGSCFYITRGVHPALSFRLGSAPWSNSSFTASASPWRIHGKKKTHTHIKHSGWSQPKKGPVFINYMMQWVIDYCVWDAEADYNYVCKDYCEEDNSLKTGWSWSGHLCVQQSSSGGFRTEKRRTPTVSYLYWSYVQRRLSLVIPLQNCGAPWCWALGAGRPLDRWALTLPLCSFLLITPRTSGRVEYGGRDLWLSPPGWRDSGPFWRSL